MAHCESILHSIIAYIVKFTGNWGYNLDSFIFIENVNEKHLIKRGKYQNIDVKERARIKCKEIEHISDHNPGIIRVGFNNNPTLEFDCITLNLEGLCVKPSEHKDITLPSISLSRLNALRYFLMNEIKQEGSIILIQEIILKSHNIENMNMMALRNIYEIQKMLPNEYNYKYDNYTSVVLFDTRLWEYIDEINIFRTNMKKLLKKSNAYKLRCRITKKEIIIVNIHLKAHIDFKSVFFGMKDKRYYELKNIIDKIKHFSNNFTIDIILGGDFNSILDKTDIHNILESLDK